MTSSVRLLVERVRNTVRERICGPVSMTRSAAPTAGKVTMNIPCPSLVVLTPPASMATPDIGAPPFHDTTCPDNDTVVGAGEGDGAVGPLEPELSPPPHAAAI